MATAVSDKNHFFLTLPLEVLLYRQLMEDHILSLDPWLVVTLFGWHSRWSQKALVLFWCKKSEQKGGRCLLVIQITSCCCNIRSDMQKTYFKSHPLYLITLKCIPFPSLAIFRNYYSLFDRIHDTGWRNFACSNLFHFWTLS